MQNFIEIGPKMRLLRLLEENPHATPAKNKNPQIGPIRKIFFFKINEKFWKQQI